MIRRRKERVPDVRLITSKDAEALLALLEQGERWGVVHVSDDVRVEVQVDSGHAIVDGPVRRTIMLELIEKPGWEPSNA